MNVVLKIGMVDVDLLNNGTRHPNLAQMKMSNYCKQFGHDVELVYNKEQLSKLSDYNILLVSKVFSYTTVPSELEKLIKQSNKTNEELNGSVKKILQNYSDRKPCCTQILIGGTGFFENGGCDLDYEIEHYMPDYSLYDSYIKQKISEGRSPAYFSDYIGVSIGFISRGCHRKCSFCVNKKYDKAFVHFTGISEFYNPNCRVIYLWDDNFLALGKKCIPILNELNKIGKPFQFRQGLDIRLMNDEFAQILSKSRYYGDYIFAFDHIQDKDWIIHNLKIWRKYCKKETKLYILCGYDSYTDDSKYSISKWFTQDERDLIDIRNTFERIYILMQFGCLPYIMKYMSYNDSKYRGIYVQLGRWCNQPGIFKKMSFEEFCVRNQHYSKTSNDCAPLRALKLLKADAPEVYEQYAKLKYSEVLKKFRYIYDSTED